MVVDVIQHHSGRVQQRTRGQQTAKDGQRGKCPLDEQEAHRHVGHCRKDVGDAKQLQVSYQRGRKCLPLLLCHPVDREP